MLAASAAALTGLCWGLLWTQDTFWNPLLFTGMWTGATLLMYALGPNGYPGWRVHTLLLLVSVPIWWWFELVNSRVRNWEYVEMHDYSSVEYALLASLAFATVVPALHAAWRLSGGVLRLPPLEPRAASRPLYLFEMSAGLASVAMVFILPGLFFPLVWVGPFLLLDGVVGFGGGRSLVLELWRREWRLAASIGLAGLLCGFLWEFWNFWATPKWVYDIAYVEFLHVFEMPLLGYGGYVPFAWSIHQLLQIGRLKRALELSGAGRAGLG